MYKKESEKVTDELHKRSTQMFVAAYNKAAQDMNDGGIDRFNKEQESKYGKNYTKRSGYEDDYRKMFDKELTKYSNKLLNEFYESNDNFKRAQSLVRKYDMTKWDELARTNSEAIQSLRNALENER